MGGKRREDIVNIRAVAIMLVAFGHSIIIYSGAWNLYETSVQAPVLDHLKNVVNMLQMPLFFSVSGFCLVFTLARGGNGLDARRFLWNKCRRILLPFLIIAFLWLLPIRLLLRYPGYQNQPITRIILKDVLWGADNGHLWFLPTLFLMFTLSLILIKACGTGIRLDITMGALALLAVAAFGLARPLVVWNNYLLQFSNYFIFFALGFIYHRHEHLLYRRHEHSGTRPAVPKPAVALILAACMALSWRTWPTPIALILSALSVLAVYLLAPRASCPPLRLVSRDSMGIYLLHSPMLYISFTYWPDIHPLLMILINFIGFGAIAILMTELMRRAHLGFVIGE